MVNFKHGHKRKDNVSPEYISWLAILARCTNPNNPNFQRYGARGISVCERWRNNFESFLEDMGTRPSRNHSVERIDNSGNYDPANCKWATAKEQANNRRSSRFVDLHGERKTLSEWCQLKGLGRSTVSQRLRYGWTVEKALLTPLRG